MNMNHRSTSSEPGVSLSLLLALASAAAADIKIAHIYGKTGPFEAYAKQSHDGLMLGLEYREQSIVLGSGIFGRSRSSTLPNGIDPTHPCAVNSHCSNSNSQRTSTCVRYCS